MSDRPVSGLLRPTAVVALLLLSLACTADRPGQEAPPAPAAPRQLAAGVEIRADIEAGQRHPYTVTMDRGDAAAVEVAQRGADVVIDLRSPRGTLVTTVDSFTGASRSEHVFWLAEEPGEHRLEVHFPEAYAEERHGSYLITLTEPPRPATRKDRLRVRVARTSERGVEEFVNGEYDAAAATFLTAADGFVQLGDTLFQAGALFSAGQAHRSRQDPAAAAEAYRQAAELYRRLGMPRDEGLRRGNVGEMLQELDRHEEAIASYEAARDIYQSLPDLDDRDRRELAVFLNNLGRLHSILADSESALAAYRQSLSVVAAPESRDGPAVLRNMADEYRLNGDLRTAEELYGRAIALARERGDREQEAWSKSRLCQTLHEMERGEEAESCIAEALSLHQEGRGEAVSRVTLAQIAERAGELQTARENQEAALEVFRNLQDELSTAIVLNNLGWNDLAAGEPAAALDHLEAALPTLERLDRRREMADALAGIARAYGDLDRLEAALETNQRSISVLEELRRGPVAPALRARALERRYSTYAYQVELLMRKHELHPDEGWDARALTACERARARTLLETLVKASDPSAVNGPATEERRLIERLRKLEERHAELLWRGDEEAQNSLGRLALEIEEAERAWWRLRAGRGGAGSADQRLAEPLTAAEIQRRSVDEGTLMLSFHVGAERSFLWAVSRKRTTSHVLPSRRELAAVAGRAHRLSSDSRRILRRVPAQRELRKLSQLLLAPVADQLDGTRRLLVIAEEALLYVPFAALPLPDEQRPLITEHEVVVLPSASLLSALRRQVAGRPPAAGAVAVIADPVYQEEDLRIGGAGRDLSPRRASDPRRTGDELERLPHSLREKDAIVELAPPGDRFIATGVEANLDAVLSGKLSGYRVVHLATHARVYADRPRASLILSRFDAAGNRRPGELRSDQIYRLRLPAELVTLSACSTALGEEIRGEGLVGLTHGFFTAGAARVLVSLWNVGDDSTAVLMERFYDALFRHGQSPAAALRSAQLSMWRQEEWRAPYHWAGFVLQGEPR